MPREIRDGVQNFATFRENDLFYVDKTDFLRQWWLGAPDTSEVSLITRPRRFGKTLMLSTVEHFFSTRYAGRSDLFEGLAVWQDGKMREQQGRWPVIFLSLSSVKGSDFATLNRNLCQKIADLFSSFRELKTAKEVEPEDLARFSYIQTGMRDGFDCYALNFLCDLLNRTSGKKVILLLDEYDTPLQEAWLNTFWKEATNLLRTLYNAAFKDNPVLKRAIVTGITRVSKESIFSDLNNLGIYSVSTPFYETSFGFTEAEVFAAMDERGLTDKAGVKSMYDGYIFGRTGEIYNPWSVVSYLKNPVLDTWWANTSSNALVSKLVRESSEKLKQDFQTMLEGGTIKAKIDEQIIFSRLTGKVEAVWSLLLASGYLKPVFIKGKEYELAIVNGEVRQMLEEQIAEWFADTDAYGNFVNALLDGDLDEMNEYMNDVAFECFSYFDTAGKTEKSKPERFYHGFVLGLLVELRDRYILTSNRESGTGRYDIMLEPRDQAQRTGQTPAFVIEFKVHKPRKENTLEETVAAALAQIEAKGYAQQLVERGIPAENIRKYGFAFRGKEVLIGQG